MFNHPILDIVIGLVFIYLLYSLFVTTIAEIIATKLGLRARNLKEAIDRMLNDEADMNILQRLWDSIKILKNPNNKIVRNFYAHPEIKYLGSSGVFRIPSSFKAVSFSKTLIYLLNCSNSVDPQKIDEELRLKAPKVLGKETADYVLSMWEDSGREVVKFKQQLEAWFDRTMEQATEWYKRKIQIILLLLSFFVAWIFNVDTIGIVKNLSKDKDARDQMVKLATAYIETHPESPKKVSALLDSANAEEYKRQLDSLLAVKKQLENDIAGTQMLLGSSNWLPDSAVVRTEAKTGKKILDLNIDAGLLPANKIPKDYNGSIQFSRSEKWRYFFGALGSRWPGFLITAIALSLGAPFWFDLLNKMMKLRTSIKQPVVSTNTNADNTVLPSDSIKD